MNNSVLIAVDFETSYEKDRDIKSLGAYGYLQHPETDIYMVAIYGDGLAYVGPPKEAPWPDISGATWLSHNRTFDWLCYQRLLEFGEVPALPSSHQWHCTSDMSVYFGGPRSLAQAARLWCNVEVDKSMREEAKGYSWVLMGRQFQRDMAEYALFDAKACYLLGQKLLPDYPEIEAYLSAHTTAMTTRGIAVDEGLLVTYRRTLTEQLIELERQIPWTSAGEKPTSPKALAAECHRLGIPPPVSVDEKSPYFLDWANKYSKNAPFVAAMKHYRSVNALLEKVKAFQTRIFDGRVRYSLKYFGASTGRWSGDGGLNLLNLPREAMYGVDLRRVLIAGEGNKFISADLNAIEARVCYWLAKDTPVLDLLRQGIDIYEANARRSGLYNDPELGSFKRKAKDLRFLEKVKSLGLQYQMGAARLKATAMSVMGHDMTIEQAQAMVTDWRRANAPIAQLWRTLDNALKTAIIDAAQNESDAYLELCLPSGRVLRYCNLVEKDGNIEGQQTVLDPPEKLYPGKLLENLCQAISRDILALAIQRIERETLGKVVLHIYDEVLVEVPSHAAEACLKQVIGILSEAPCWAKALPLTADGSILEHYTKE